MAVSGLYVGGYCSFAVYEGLKLIAVGAQLRFGNPLHDKEAAAIAIMVMVIVSVGIGNEDSQGHRLGLVKTGHGSYFLPGTYLRRRGTRGQTDLCKSPRGPCKRETVDLRWDWS
uniref:Uncharacterized protein n=1 Tax=Oryza nivara TaxID=4536 RepID=A0A0E0FLC0_ORYNI